MMNCFRATGFILMILGAGMMDSEIMWIPGVITLLGALIMFFLRNEE